MRKLLDKYDLKLIILTFISFALLCFLIFIISFGISYSLLYLIGYLFYFHVTIQVILLGMWLLLVFIKLFVLK